MSDELTDIDRLVETEERTNPDGTVNVTIEGWARNDTDVIVEFEVIDSVHTERMPWPQPGGDLTEYKFYRLVRGAGLEMRNADLLAGEAAQARSVEQHAYDWKLVVPESTSRVESTKSRLAAGKEWFDSVNWTDTMITVFWIASMVSLVVIALLSLT